MVSPEPMSKIGPFVGTRASAPPDQGCATYSATFTSGVSPGGSAGGKLPSARTT